MAQTYLTTANDTLWGIAQRFYGDGTYWHLIYEANRNLIGPSPAALKAGQQLIIPDQAAAQPPAQGNDQQYLVQANDTLWDLAERFYGDGTKWTVIYEANRAVIGENPQNLFSGKQLRIPHLQNWRPPSNQGPYQPAPARPISGRTISDSPAAIYYLSMQDFLVFGNSDGSLYQVNAGLWHDLGRPPAGVTMSPGVVVRAPATIHVAVRGGDTHLYQKYWDGQRWSGWENRGGDLASGPALASWSPDRLDCFALGMFQNLIHCAWDLSSGWSAWEDLSPQLPDARFNIQFAPTAVSWGPGRLDVFAVRAGNGELLHALWDGRWHGWHRLGGILTEAPSVISRGPSLLDVFGRGTDGQIFHIFWDGRRWSNWYGLGRYSASAPAAAAGPPGIAIFARATSGGLQRLY